VRYTLVMLIGRSPHLSISLYAYIDGKILQNVPQDWNHRQYWNSDTAVNKTCSTDQPLKRAKSLASPREGRELPVV
jgi:hypothetical protein